MSPIFTPVGSSTSDTGRCWGGAAVGAGMRGVVPRLLSMFPSCFSSFHELQRQSCCLKLYARAANADVLVALQRCFNFSISHKGHHWRIQKRKAAAEIGECSNICNDEN
eukprot:301194-Rhodomonas_salina.2